MTTNRLIGSLVLALALAGCSDGGAPPPPIGGSAGTGNVGGTGNAGGTGNVGGTSGTGGGGFGGNGGIGGVGGSGGNGGFGAGVGGSGGLGGDGGVGGAGAEGSDECNNQSDIDAIVAVAPTSARQVAAQCGVNCEGEDGDQAFLSCANPCIETSIAALSTECGSCYGDFAVCIRTCLSECALDACVPACEACPDYALCFNNLDVCAGRDSRDCFDEI